MLHYSKTALTANLEASKTSIYIASIEEQSEQKVMACKITVKIDMALVKEHYQTLTPQINNLQRVLFEFKTTTKCNAKAYFSG